MRLKFTSALAAILLAFVAAPSGAQEKKAHDMHGAASGEKGHEMSGWKEMDTFHASLGAAFHPTEQGNFAPLKATADTLAARAKAWSLSTAPASCASAEVKASVGWLATSTADLASQVRAGAADPALKSAIAAIHEKFESVEKTCGLHGMQGMKH